MPAISFLPFLQNVPSSTRLLTALLILFSLAGFGLQNLANENLPKPGPAGLELPWLVLVPGKSLIFPWTVLTAGLVELSVFELIFSIITLVLATRYLDRIWGFLEVLRFSAVVIVGSNVIAFGFSWIVWFVTGSEEALYGLPYHGLSGLQVGFLVAFTQLIPEHQIQLLGALRIKVKALPGIYLLISNVLIFVLGSSPYMLVQFGFFVAWAYLRFFKLSEDGLRGDRSETFAFQYWFPGPVRPYIAKAGNLVFKLAVKVKLVQAWDDPVQYSALPGPGGARAEAERRRAMALKALDARIASTAPAPPAAVHTAGPLAASSSSSSSGVPASGLGAGVGAGAGAGVGAGDESVVGGSTTAPPPLKTAVSSRSVGGDKPEKVKD
ncbi:eukaryotic integral membrane protein-domain-containing protein [Dioszegia hungarica]|uniref:Eukaryotic integral membrane protein-domain-containing protein n=1 Tax=Dioszegia hungarica TaxID=4972 RepID=A0AA38LQF3_9TREE|nr:eukaryotic integral membrane protein-domain-containing protein [Dioszegia hungarica]KAI9631800.1 eukaryotic integral membrane protein-domain-containing protein [Dioszegia hungarica]